MAGQAERAARQAGGRHGGWPVRRSEPPPVRRVAARGWPALGWPARRREGAHRGAAGADDGCARAPDVARRGWDRGTGPGQRSPGLAAAARRPRVNRCRRGRSGSGPGFPVGAANRRGLVQGPGQRQPRGPRHPQQARPGAAAGASPGPRAAGGVTASGPVTPTGPRISVPVGGRSWARKPVTATAAPVTATAATAGGRPSSVRSWSSRVGVQGVKPHQGLGGRMPGVGAHHHHSPAHGWSDQGGRRHHRFNAASPRGGPAGPTAGRRRGGPQPGSAGDDRLDPRGWPEPGPGCVAPHGRGTVGSGDHQGRTGEGPPSFLGGPFHPDPAGPQPAGRNSADTATPDGGARTGTGHRVLPGPRRSGHLDRAVAGGAERPAADMCRRRCGAIARCGTWISTGPRLSPARIADQACRGPAPRQRGDPRRAAVRGRGHPGQWPRRCSRETVISGPRPPRSSRVASTVRDQRGQNRALLVGAQRRTSRAWG